MTEPSKIAEAFAQLMLVCHKQDAAARHLFDLCVDNPEMMQEAADAFADIAGMITRWKERAREFGVKDDDGQRRGIVCTSHRPVLMHAVIRNDPPKVAALIKAGVLLDETDEGETALHWAVSRQHTEIVAMLLDAGANPNVADNDGYTPLHDVAEMGNCPPARMMLEALLAAGANTNLREKNGRTPSELAESMGYAMPSFQTTLPQSPSSSRAADNFAMIRARIRELRRDE